MTKEKDLKKDKKVTKSKQKEQEKKSLWTKFRTFLAGVRSEFKKVHWPSKIDMLKYSIATVLFVVFCSLFFYAIEVIFALVQTLIK